MAEARAEGESLAIPNGTTESEIAAAKEGTILGAPGDRPDSPEMKEETTNGDVKVEDPEKDAGDHVEAQKESTGAESQSNGIKRTTSPQQSERKNDVKERKTGNLSNLVSQEESSDPVAIRKQVNAYFNHEASLFADTFFRWSFISQIRTSLRTSSCSLKWMVTRTIQCPSALFTASSA